MAFGSNCGVKSIGKKNGVEVEKKDYSKNSLSKYN